MIVTQREREREREADTQAEGEAGSMHREPDVGLDPGSPGSCPRPKAGAKPLRHPGIPLLVFLSSGPVAQPRWGSTVSCRLPLQSGVSLEPLCFVQRIFLCLFGAVLILFNPTLAFYLLFRGFLQCLIH